MWPGPVRVLRWNRGTGLGVDVVVMVMAMMMMRGGESRSSKYHQKQGGGENLFHGTNVAWWPGAWKSIPEHAPRKARGVSHSRTRSQNGVDWIYDDQRGRFPAAKP